MSVGCGEAVWKVLSECLEGWQADWRVSGVCLEGVGRMSV